MATPLRAEDLSRRASDRHAHARYERGFTVGALTPIMLVVLVAYLIIGLAMPVLPLFVHQELGLSAFMVGVAAGVEFAAALLSRFWSGRYADTRGARRAVVVGLLIGVGVRSPRFWISHWGSPILRSGSSRRMWGSAPCFW